MINTLLALAAACAFAAPSEPLIVTPTRAVEVVLDDWHDAAAKADYTRYFAHFADEGVFIGSDASERWDNASFHAFAKPIFDKGKAWTLVAKERHVSISADGNTAWFDEKVDSPKYGLCRGTGVLVKTNGEWKVAQYNYTLPIPNSLFKQVVKMIADAAATPKPAPK